MKSIEQRVDENDVEESKHETKRYILVAQDYSTLDRALICTLQDESDKLERGNNFIDVPPIFKAPTAQIKQMSSKGVDNDKASLYFMQTGYIGQTGRTVCKLISVKGSEDSEEQRNQKVAIKMHSGAYMFAHRLAAYKKELGLEVFMKFKVSNKFLI